MWVRAYIPSGGSDSVWMSLDGGAYEQAKKFGYKETDGVAYVWRLAATYSNLSAGTKHNFRLYPREGSNRIDMVLITDQTSRVPVGMGDLTAITLPATSTPYRISSRRRSSTRACI